MWRLLAAEVAAVTADGGRVVAGVDTLVGSAVDGDATQVALADTLLEVTDVLGDTHGALGRVDLEITTHFFHLPYFLCLWFVNILNIDANELNF